MLCGFVGINRAVNKVWPLFLLFVHLLKSTSATTGGVRPKGQDLVQQQFLTVTEYGSQEL